jgi:nucleoside-diphosphate-sugar epimerase
LAKIVCEIVDNKITYNILWEENSKAPSRSCPDISKWIKELWFKPIYNLSETFKRTLDSFYS